MRKQNAAALAAFERHRPLAERIASKFRRRFHGGTLAKEVTAAAFVGLWQASLSKPKLPDDQFAAFASVRIRGAILDEIRAHDPLPRRARKNFGPVLFISIDGSAGGRRDSPSDDQEQSHLLAQFAVEPDAEDKLLDKERLAMVTDAIALLRRRERNILALLMNRSAVEVASDLGVSQPRVSQIRTRIIGKIQCSLGLAPAQVTAARDWRALKKK